MARRKITQGRDLGEVPDVPEVRSGRSREWEKAQRSGGEYKAVTYRKIPVELRDYIRAVAEENGVVTDEVARAFLEFAMRAHQEGRLELNPRLKPGKHTLY